MDPLHPQPDQNGDEATIESLKEILFAPEVERIRQLEERPVAEIDQDELTQVLPIAVREAASRDDRLSRSLSPIMSDALQSSIKRNPKPMVDAISPIMGPMIREWINRSISGMLQSFNQTLNYSMSPKGLRWRWEALTTGRSFAEVVMLKTLVYRVSEVFLIDRETSLLLRHMSAGGEASDTDLVSGMLSAIQDFVRDSFGASDSESLHTMQFGDQTVWVETGPRAILAAVAQGAAPESVRTTVRDILETIHVEFDREFEQFEKTGDNGPFEKSDPLLSECFSQQFEHEAKAEAKAARPRAWWRKWVWLAAFGCVTLALFNWWRANHEARQLARLRTRLGVPDTASIELNREGQLTVMGSASDEWLREVQIQATRFPQVTSVDVTEVQNRDRALLDFLDELGQTPGVRITEVERDGDQTTIRGLRDPLSADPQAILSGYDAVDATTIDFDWSPYHSLERQFVGERVIQRLQVPQTAAAEYDGDRVAVTGTADSQWIQRLDSLRLTLPPGIEIDTTGLKNLDELEFERLAGHLDSLRILHLVNDYQFVEGQESQFAEMAKGLVQLLELAERTNMVVRVTLLGHSAAQRQPDGSPPQLSFRRARAVWSRLGELGVPTDDVSIQGVKIDQPTNPQQTDVFRTTVQIDRIE